MVVVGTGIEVVVVGAVGAEVVVERGARRRVVGGGAVAVDEDRHPTANGAASTATSATDRHLRTPTPSGSPGRDLRTRTPRGQLDRRATGARAARRGDQIRTNVIISTSPALARHAHWNSALCRSVPAVSPCTVATA